ncbi:MAG: SDR family NAD(P)-dependent oxidoreductase [Alphaproteobacteria bacterium]|nr:SDR family NAD(P)-dependent oxidoreductase [Alphaproteobacteria bacterium]
MASSILITGASSGLGAALAELYSAPGVHLALVGRDAGRLEAVATRCRDAGATVASAGIDVTDRAAMARWVTAAEAAHPLDLVIANAGVSAGTGRGEESADQVRRILAINVDGAMNTVLPAMPPMIARRRGQIALMASLAAFRGFPGAPAYCASKATLKIFGEGLRGDLAPRGVGVTVICPGYVDTAMTRVNTFRMPFLMDAEGAARIIRHGLERNRARIAFPWPLAFVAWLAGTLPPAWLDPLLARLPRKV